MRDELIKEYEGLYGEKPHHKMSDENIQKKINEFGVVGSAEKRSNEEKITLTKSELDSYILQKIRESNMTPDLREGNDWKEIKEEKQYKTARMRLYRKDTNSPFGLVLSKKFLKNEWDEETRKYNKPIYEVRVKFDDKEEKITMPLMEYIQINDFEAVEIIDTQSKKLAKSVGKVRRAMSDRSGYSRSVFPGGNGAVDNPLLGDYVDQEVVRIEAIHTIKRPNGEILEVNNDQLNG